MIKILAVLVFCLPAFGQAAYFGQGNYSGAATFSIGSGAPLTYPARTDNCVTGSETGCVAGTTTGEAGSALSFLLRSSDAVAFPDITTGNANMNATGTDPDFGATFVMATDESTASNCLGASSPWTANWDMGSTGASIFFSTDSKLLLVGNDQGSSCILFLNPAAIHSKTCATATPACVVNSGLGTFNSLTGVAFSFSTVPGETNVLYALQSVVSGQLVQVNRLVICRYANDPNGCSGQSTFPSVISTPYADMRNTNTSVCGANMTLSGGGGNTAVYSGPGSGTWSSVFLTGTDGSVAWGTGGAQDYNSSAWTPLVGQTFILPTVDNTNKSAFYASAVTGATSGTEPNWTSSCSTTNSTCTDGGVTWTNIGGIGGQGPGFTIFYYKPEFGCSMWNTRSGYVYTTGTL